MTFKRVKSLDKKVHHVSSVIVPTILSKATPEDSEDQE